MPDGSETVKGLREQAARCRWLAERVTDGSVSRKLLEMAAELDCRAEALEAAERCAPEA